MAMTTQTSITTTVSFNPLAARAAFASGVFGLVAVGFLIASLALRATNFEQGMLMSRIHNAATIVQVLFMMPVVAALHKLSQQPVQRASPRIQGLGIGALSFTALFLLLGMTRVIADVLYMFPQGVFGVWLMIFCWQARGILAPFLRWFGMVVGLGLALVGTFPLEYAIFVDTIMLAIPAASDAEVQKIPINEANRIIHQILWIGAPLGVLTLPFWTLLLGRRLLRRGANELMDTPGQMSTAYRSDR